MGACVQECGVDIMRDGSGMRAAGRLAVMLSCLVVALTVAPAATAGQGRLVALKTAYHTSFNVYVAGPEDAPYGALLVPDRWGFNDRLLAWADRLGELGYRVVAVDYFDGRRVPNETLAREVIKAIDPVWIDADLDSALAYLHLQPRRVVVLAWGAGGEYAAHLARRKPGAVSALVFYHERRGEGLGAVAELAVPVLEVVTEKSLLRVGGLPGQAVEDTWRATVDFLKSNFQ